MSDHHPASAPRFVFEVDAKNITCGYCGSQYRTLTGATEHVDREHADIDDDE